MKDRNLDWDGTFNARDLGGLPTRDGLLTRWGALVRSDGLGYLTARGWAALEAHGVRTVVDLRNDDELEPDPGPGAPTVSRVHAPMDDTDDTELWEHIRTNELDGSPLYFPLFLERKPERCAAVVSAVARAAPDGVLFHCGAGRDRTGLIAALLLSLAGVDPDHIVADYEMSTDRLRRLYEARGQPDQGPEIAAILERKQTTAASALRRVIDGLDAEAYLLAAGVPEADLHATRRRLLGPNHTR